MSRGVDRAGLGKALWIKCLPVEDNNIVTTSFLVMLLSVLFLLESRGKWIIIGASLNYGTVGPNI